MREGDLRTATAKYAKVDKRPSSKYMIVFWLPPFLCVAARVGANHFAGNLKLQLQIRVEGSSVFLAFSSERGGDLV